MINSDGGKRREGLWAETLYGARQSLAPADTEAKRFRAQRTSGTKEGSVWCAWGTVWRGWSSGICGRAGLAGLKMIILFNILANNMSMAIIRCPILWLMGHKNGQVDQGRSFTHPLYASHTFTLPVSTVLGAGSSQWDPTCLLVPRELTWEYGLSHVNARSWEGASWVHRERVHLAWGVGWPPGRPHTAVSTETKICKVGGVPG